MEAVSQPTLRGPLPWALVSALPPAAIGVVYLTLGPGLQSSRSQFVVAFLALLVLASIAGAVSPSQQAALSAMTVALTGTLALGITAGFSFGLFLMIGAVPAAVAIGKLSRDVPRGHALVIVVVLVVATLAMFGTGLVATRM